MSRPLKGEITDCLSIRVRWLPALVQFCIGLTVEHGVEIVVEMLCEVRLLEEAEDGSIAECRLVYLTCQFL